jgi:hypothetical protein
MIRPYAQLESMILILIITYICLLFKKDQLKSIFTSEELKFDVISTWFSNMIELGILLRNQGYNQESSQVFMAVMGGIAGYHFTDSVNLLYFEMRLTDLSLDNILVPESFESNLTLDDFPEHKQFESFERVHNFEILEAKCTSILACILTNKPPKMDIPKDMVLDVTRILILNGQSCMVHKKNYDKANMTFLAAFTAVNILPKDVRAKIDCSGERLRVSQKFEVFEKKTHKIS